MNKIRKSDFYYFDLQKNISVLVYKLLINSPKEFIIY